MSHAGYHDHDDVAGTRLDSSRGSGSGSVCLVYEGPDFGEDEETAFMGKMMTDLINHVQVRKNGREVARTMANKAWAGGTVHRAPLGYRNCRVETVEGVLVNSVTVDEVRGPLVRRAFELYASGEFSVVRLAEELAVLGLRSRPGVGRPGRPVCAGQLHALLRNPYYLGCVVFKGEVVPGRHPALVDGELFERVQEVLRRRSGRHRLDREHRHFLKGLLQCARCRAAGRVGRLVYTRARGRRGVVYEYFFCRRRQERVAGRPGCDLPYLPVRLVEQAVAAHVAGLALPGVWLAEARGQIAGAAEEQLAARQEVRVGVRTRRRELERQQAALVEAVAEGLLPVEAVRARQQELQRQQLQLASEAGEDGAGVGLLLERVTAYLELLERPGELYRALPEQLRGQLLEVLFEQLYLDTDPGRPATGPQLSSRASAPVAALRQAAESGEVGVEAGRSEAGDNAGGAARPQAAPDGPDTHDETPRTAARGSSGMKLVGDTRLELMTSSV